MLRRGQPEFVVLRKKTRTTLRLKGDRPDLSTKTLTEPVSGVGIARPERRRAHLSPDTTPSASLWGGLESELAQLRRQAEEELGPILPPAAQGVRQPSREQSLAPEVQSPPEVSLAGEAVAHPVGSEPIHGPEVVVAVRPDFRMADLEPVGESALKSEAAPPPADDSPEDSSKTDMPRPSGRRPKRPLRRAGGSRPEAGEVPQVGRQTLQPLEGKSGDGDMSARVSEAQKTIDPEIIRLLDQLRAAEVERDAAWRDISDFRRRRDTSIGHALRCLERATGEAREF